MSVNGLDAMAERKREGMTVYFVVKCIGVERLENQQRR